LVIEGNVEIDGYKLTKRDAIGVWNTELIDIKIDANAELLVVEVPMN
jgi:quercetin 2,3-dioxygenase